MRIEHLQPTALYVSLAGRCFTISSLASGRANPDNGNVTGLLGHSKPMIGTIPPDPQDPFRRHHERHGASLGLMNFCIREKILKLLSSSSHSIREKVVSGLPGSNHQLVTETIRIQIGDGIIPPGRDCLRRRDFSFNRLTRDRPKDRPRERPDTGASAWQAPVPARFHERHPVVFPDGLQTGKTTG